MLCGESYTVVSEDVRESDASFRIRNFERTSYRALGIAQWELRAEEAFLYQQAGSTPARVVTYGFTFREFDDSGQLQSTVRGERGEMNNEEQELRVSGDVFFEDREGRRVEGSEMTYDMEREILTTDQPVVIRDRGLYSRCAQGAVIYMQEDRQICRGPVIQSTSGGAGVEESINVFE